MLLWAHEISVHYTFTLRMRRQTSRQFCFAKRQGFLWSSRAAYLVIMWNEGNAVRNHVFGLCSKPESLRRSVVCSWCRVRPRANGWIWEGTLSPKRYFSRGFTLVLALISLGRLIPGNIFCAHGVAKSWVGMIFPNTGCRSTRQHGNVQPYVFMTFFFIPHRWWISGKVIVCFFSVLLC